MEIYVFYRVDGLGLIEQGNYLLTGTISICKMTQEINLPKIDNESLFLNSFRSWTQPSSSLIHLDMVTDVSMVQLD